MKLSFRYRIISKHYSICSCVFFLCLLQTVITWSWPDAELLKMPSRNWLKLWMSIKGSCISWCWEICYVINHHCCIFWLLNLLDHTHGRKHEYYSTKLHQGRATLNEYVQYHSKRFGPRMNIKWKWETPDEYLCSSSPLPEPLQCAVSLSCLLKFSSIKDYILKLWANNTHLSLCH